jgi:hypothetical protein
MNHRPSPSSSSNQKIIPHPLIIFDYRGWWKSAILIKWPNNYYSLPGREMYTYEDVRWTVEEITQETFRNTQGAANKQRLLTSQTKNVIHHVFSLQISGKVTVNDNTTLWFYPLSHKCEEVRKRFNVYVEKTLDKDTLAEGMRIDAQSKKILDEIRLNNNWSNLPLSNITILGDYFEIFKKELLQFSLNHGNRNTKNNKK